MSAQTASLPSGAELDAAVTPALQGVALGQCHRFAVRGHLEGRAVSGVLTLQGTARCLLQLAPGVALGQQGQRVNVALCFEGGLHRPAVPVRLQGHWLDPAAGSLALEWLGQRPMCLAERDRFGSSITATARSPLLFNRQLQVQVHYLNPFNGVLQVTGWPMMVLPGMDLELRLSERWSAPAPVKVQVMGCYEDQGRYLCHFRVLDARSSTAVALALLCLRPDFSFEDLPPRIRKSAAVDRLINVAIVEGHAALEQVLACRLAANRHYGRLGDVLDPRSLWDEWDPFSIQVSARLGEKCVGAGRVVINGGVRERCEIQAATPLPEWLWNAGFVEMSRVAILPAYAGHRVMLALLRELGRITLHARSRYIVLDAIEILVPIYTRLGAQCLPISKKHPYSGETVRVMYFDIGQLLSALNRQLPQWLYVFGPTVAHSVPAQQVPELATHFQVSAWGMRTKRGLANGLKKIMG
ncbi:hypothetical protein [Pseudomonas sp. TE3610]